MFIPLTPSLHQDEPLKEIDAHLLKLEQVLIQEYRRLLVGAHKGLDELLRFPAQLAVRFQQILGKLQRALEGTGDHLNLRIVTDHQEELRIRMLVLEHLLERDIPFAYLERAFHPAVHSAIFAHRGEGVERDAYRASEHTAAQSNTHTPPRRWLTKILRQDTPATAPKRASAHHAGVSGGRKWFQNLPDYLKSLFLLHHFMEKDELRLLKPAQRAPSLGAEYSLHGGVAVFEAEDGGEYHWRARAERQGRPDDDRLARSLQEKLTQQNYVVGVRSQFHGHSRRESGRGAPLAEQLPRGPHAGSAHRPDELRHRLQHLAAPTGVRASFEDTAAANQPADETPWLAIDYTP